ncbi:rhomboid family intramembrane serine protease [Halovenus rubra]|uniref:Rhomboid family intramembrane serine protease n=2 Tax=Halovenus rubra TaxID=869890 RepID=A0ABD5X791_9EURY|nr:rhomboid family intramembrane serine protease [Halovenus rubra]
MVVESVSRVGVVVMVLVAIGYLLSLVGHRTLWNVLTDRFAYGVPWGSLLVIGGVFAFYLFAQSGLHHWNDPVTLAFRNWAYPYAVGMLTSGFAHASPSHLLGNMLATVVLAPLAEFIWGHYPHDNRQTGMTELVQQAEITAPATPAPTEFDTGLSDSIPSDGTRSETATDTPVSDASKQEATPANQQSTRLRDHPAVRALVIFPGAIIAVSLLTSLYAFGWSLGFSGTVFAFLGFVLLRYPIATAVGMLVISLLSTLLDALFTPVLRVTAANGLSEPPAWAGVNVQAHMLGFLSGVLLALALLWARDEIPDPRRLFVATVLVTTVRGLWQLSTANDGVFVRYQGIGVIFILLLAVLISYIAVCDDTALTGYTPIVIRGIGALWVLGALGVGIGAILINGTATMTVLAVAALTALVVLPGTVLVVPDSVFNWSITPRRLLFASLLLITVVIALPSVGGNSLGMDSDAVPEGALSIDGYHVSYAENIQHGRTNSTDSGLVVSNDQRYVWSVAVDSDTLAHDKTTTVPVGGIGWRETVTAERTGWNVVGNDSVYIVDLNAGEKSIQSFTSNSSQATVKLDGSRFTVVPADNSFRLNITRGSKHVGSTLLPDTSESVTLDKFTISALEQGGTTTLFVSTDNSQVILAQKE